MPLSALSDRKYHTHFFLHNSNNSSLAHEVHPRGGIDFKTINDVKASSAVQRYGRSKLANLLFAKALAQRLKDERVYVNIAHPGIVATELNRQGAETFGKFITTLIDTMVKVVAMKPEVGALTQLYCATSPDIEKKDIRGKYFIPIANELDPSKFCIIFCASRKEGEKRNYGARADKLIIVATIRPTCVRRGSSRAFVDLDREPCPRKTQGIETLQL